MVELGCKSATGVVGITVGQSDHALADGITASWRTHILYSASEADQWDALVKFYHDLGNAINDAAPGSIYPLPDNEVPSA